MRVWKLSSFTQIVIDLFFSLEEIEKGPQNAKNFRYPYLKEEILLLLVNSGVWIRPAFWSSYRPIITDYSLWTSGIFQIFHHFNTQPGVPTTVFDQGALLVLPAEFVFCPKLFQVLLDIMICQFSCCASVSVTPFVFILGVLLFPLFEVTDSCIFKVKKDLKKHNSPFLSNLVAIFDIEDFLCAGKCERLTNGLSDLRQYNYTKRYCECLHASNEFRDSRDRAPKLQDALLYVNGQSQSIL